MAKLTHLPRPDPRYGWYALPDGSRIYPSGNPIEAPHKAVRPGKWFVWLYLYDELFNGKIFGIGRILLVPGGIAYFDSPEEALKAVRRQRGTGVVGDG